MSDGFSNGDDDIAGLQTLELFSATHAFNQWMFDAIKRYCSGNILEIGSGIGNLSALILGQSHTLTLSDQKAGYCKLLQTKFEGMPGFREVVQLDLSDPELISKNPRLEGIFDTVIALNVVEHIQNEAVVLANVKGLLKQGGKIIMLVPAFNSLYNLLDIELGHYRRYNKKSIHTLFRKPDWELNDTRYFNTPGIFGWWLHGTVLKRKLITSSSLTAYNKLVPVFRLADKIFSSFFGLSIIAVATVYKT